MSTRGQGRRSHYGTQYFVSYVEFNSIRAAARTAEVAGVAGVNMSWKDQPGLPITAELVSDNLLPVLLSRPVLGRFFSREEASKPGSLPVVVLSYDLWKNYYGSSEDVIGKTMILNRTPFTIIGVAEKGANGPLIVKPDIWIPLTMQAITRPGESLIEQPNAAWIQLIARRKPQYSDAQMQAEMQLLAQRSLFPHNRERTAIVTVAPGAFLNYPMILRDGAPVFLVSILAVTLVLMVACANVANMLLARGLARRKEIAIRLSIGASRARLIQQMLTESFWLSLLAGGLGLLLAQVAGKSLLAALPETEIGPNQLDLTPDTSILALTLILSLCTSLIFGLLPAFQSLRVNLPPALKIEGWDSTSRVRRFWLQHSLVATQVAVSLVLLINAGLLLRGMQRALHLDVGQAKENVVIASFDLRAQQYTPEKAERFLTTLREETAAASGVQDASLTFVDPLRNECGNSAAVVSAQGSSGSNFRVNCNEIGPEFFRTMQIPLLAGRDFTRADSVKGVRAAIVDLDIARMYADQGGAIGKRIQLGDKYEIVGVVGNTGVIDLAAQRSPAVYTSMQGLRYLEAKLVSSYTGDGTSVGKAIKQAAAVLDDNVNTSTKRIEDNIDQALLPMRIASTAAAALGGLALLLACTGVYAVVAFAVGRRLKEVGIRLALGAHKRDILRLVFWQGMKPVLIGSVLGAALAAAGARLIQAILYGLSPSDPIAFAGMALLLILVSAVAVWVPSRSALRVDPASTLRHE